MIETPNIMNKTMKIAIQLLILISSSSMSSEFSIITSTSQTVNWSTTSTPVLINCNKFEITFDTTDPNNPQSCAEYNSIDPTICINIVDITGASIINTVTSCPKISLDGQLYTADSDINIYQSNRLIIISSGGISNCINQAGNLPSIGFNFIMSIGSITTGVENISFNYDTWTLEMDSLDGNLVCDGSIGSNNDSLFSNGFE